MISVSRGGIVDENAVVEMLESGALGGAAFDVYEQEPISADHPLLRVVSDRLILSPHASGSTTQSNVRLIQGVTGNVSRAVKGTPVLDVVNGVSPAVVRRS